MTFGEVYGSLRSLEALFDLLLIGNLTESKGLIIMPPITAEQALRHSIEMALLRYQVACESSGTPLWLKCSIFGLRLADGGLLNVSIDQTIYPSGGEFIENEANSPVKPSQN